MQRNISQQAGPKMEHSESQANFLDFDVTMINGKISTEICDKRNDVSFFVLRMPNFHSNISSPIFFEIVLFEILCIAISSSELSFYEKDSAQITRLEKQVGSWGKLIKQI